MIPYEPDQKPAPTPVPSAGVDREPSKPVAKKEPLGRNQRIAIIGYGIPFAAVVLPTYLMMLVALYRNDIPSVLAGVERIANFSIVYAPIAMGTILVVAGAIKSVRALSKRHQS